MSEKKRFDTIIIGAGPGGLAAAYKLAQKQRVLVIEKGLWGGTCPNCGCDPKKMLYGVVETKRQAQLFAQTGLEGSLAIDWSALMAFKKSYTDSIPAGTEQGLAHAGIAHLHGTAHFLDLNTIEVDRTSYQARNIVIATGAQPFIPEIPGKEYLQTSTDFLSLEHLPAEIAFIGAGYVAVELANIAAQAGAKVHLIQHNKRILRGFPAEYGEKIIAALTAKKVTFHWNCEVAKVTKEQHHLSIKGTHGEQIVVDNVFAATGRPAALDDLQLAHVGIESDQRGGKVNDHLQTTKANVYAIGDAVSKSLPKLTPVSGFEGNYVAETILGATAPINYPVIAHTVFAGPELSQVGVSLAWAQKHPADYSINTQAVGSWYTYQRLRDNDAQVTTIVTKKANHLVGAVVYAANAEELINYLTALITQQLPATALANWMPVYPSAASDLKYLYS